MHGSEFFEHLLSLGEVRKRLDEVYDKLRDSVQHDLVELWTPCRFLLPGMIAEQVRGQRGTHTGPSIAPSTAPSPS